MKINRNLKITVLLIIISCLSMFGNFTVVGQCDITIDKMAVSDGGEYIAIYDDSTYMIYLFDSSYSLQSTIQPAQDFVTDIQFSENGQFLIWAASNVIEIYIFEAAIYFYDMELSKTTYTLTDIGDVALDIAFSDDSKWLYFTVVQAGYERASIHVQDIENNEQVAYNEAWYMLPAYTNDAETMFLATKRSLGITNEFSYQIEALHIPSNSVDSLIDWLEPVAAIATNIDNSKLVSSNEDGLLTIWDAGTGMEIQSWLSNTDTIAKLAFTTDGRLIVVSHSEDSSVIEVWKIESMPERVASIEFNSSIEIDFDISDNSAYVAHYEDDMLMLTRWQVDDNSVELIELDCSDNLSG